MSVQIVQFETEPQRVTEVEHAIRELFVALEEAAPSGIEYTAARVGDGPRFLLTLSLSDDATNPLLDVAEAAVFRSRLAEWAGGPVPPSTLDVLGRYEG